MSCTEKDCTGKGERRCNRCQELLCYSCWKFITDSHDGECHACRTRLEMKPEPPPPMEEWRRKMLAPLAKGRDDYNKLPRKRRTHCQNNHPLTPKNRYWKDGSVSGYWACRLCRNAKALERRSAWIEGGRVGPRP